MTTTTDRHNDAGADGDACVDAGLPARSGGKRYDADSLGTIIPPRRPEMPSHAVVCGPLTVDVAAYEARIAGRPLALTRREFALLAFFVHHPGRAFTREQLLLAVWQTQWDGRGRTVDVHVTRIRAKLAAAYFQLETVRGVGYRYRAPVAPPL